MSPEAIVEEVASAHVLTVEELVGPRRVREIVDARSEAAFRLWNETDLRLWQIGDVLGGRDHSTIHYLVARHSLRVR